MNILLLASTEEEIQGTLDYLESEWDKKSFWEYEKDSTTITTVVSGLGPMYAMYALTCHPSIKETDLILNPGIGAALSRTIDLGRVYAIEQEAFGDIGMEDSDGNFHSMHDLGWHNRNQHPFERGIIKPKNFHNPTYLPRATGMTVNKLPGTYEALENFERKAHADIISLDGATIYFVAKMLNINVLSIKVASRYVEPWLKVVPHFEGSVDQLNMRTIDVLKELIKTDKEDPSPRLIR